MNVLKGRIRKKNTIQTLDPRNAMSIRADQLFDNLYEVSSIYQECTGNQLDDDYVRNKLITMISNNLEQAEKVPDAN